MLPPVRAVMLLILVLPGLILAGGAPEGSELVAPVVVQGDLLPGHHLQTTFRIVSLVDRQVMLRIEGLSDHGRTEPIFCPGPVLGGPERTLFLPANGVVNLSTGGSAFSGWARITSEENLAESVRITTEVAVVKGPAAECPPVICTVPSDEIFTSTQLSAAGPATGFRAQAIIASQRESAFAIVNPSPQETAHVQLLAREANGEGFDANELILAPGARVSLQLWPLLLLNKSFIVSPERPENFHGSLEVTSDVPVSVGGIHVLLPEGKLVNLPVWALPDP